MKKLIAMLALLAGCAGVMVSARNILDSVVAQAKVDESTLTAICSVAVDESWDSDDLQDVLDACDRAYDLYDALEADVEALKKEMAKPSPDEAVIAGLVFRLEQNARKFADAVAALVKGAE